MSLLGDLSLKPLVTAYKGSSVQILFLQIPLLEQLTNCRVNTKLSRHQLQAQVDG